MSAPPRAPRRPHDVVAPFGTRPDPWYWLRDDEREDPDVLAHLRAENAWRDQALAHLAPFEQALYEEIVGRIKQDDTSVPVRHNGWWYYARYETGREYPIYARKRAGAGDPASPTSQAALATPEQVMVDCNARAAGHDFYQLASLEVSAG